MIPRLPLLAAPLLAASAAAQPCTPHWSDQYPPGLTGTVNAFTTFDPDERGPLPPLIIAGGLLTDASGVPANNIAAWDGVRWSPLGQGLDGEVRALATFDPDGDGPESAQLFAGGAFVKSGDLFCLRIARWDGAQWHAAAGFVDADVHALIAFDPDQDGPLAPILIAGGAFAIFDGQQAIHNIAAWDGQTWSGLGQLECRVTALTAIDEDGPGPEPARLIAGGSLNNGAGRVARWDGVAWQTLGADFDDAVLALASWDADGGGPGAEVLHAGGAFESLSHLARFIDGQWETAENGVDGGDVLALAVFDPDGPDGPEPSDLWVGGSFMWAGDLGQQFWGIAALTSDGWKNRYLGLHGDVRALHAGPSILAGRPIVPGLYLGTDDDYGRNTLLVDAVGPHHILQGIADADSEFEFAALDIDGPGPEPRSLFLVADELGPQDLGGVARLDGSEWMPLGDAGLATELIVYDDGEGSALYVGRELSEPSVIRWNGDSWSGVGGSIGDSILDFAAWDPDGDGPDAQVLVAANWYGGFLFDFPKYWNGVSWHSFPNTEFDQNEYPHVHAVASYDPDADGPIPPSLYMGGHFITLNGQPFRNLARWDGDQWQPIGGCDDGIRDFEVFDEDGDGPEPGVLFATGEFSEIGGQSIIGIARWDGSAWSQVGEGLLDGEVFQAKVMDPDGPGIVAPALYIAGDLTLADGTVTSIARLRGDHWEPIGRVADGDKAGYISGFELFDPDGPGSTAPSLYIVGSFRTADGIPSRNIAVLECAVRVCYADLDTDGSLTLFDFLGFINLFNTADPAADCDTSGGLDLFDFLCFVNAFNAGC